MQYKLSGVNVNQEDLPWWYTEILNWLAMVSSIQQCPGDNGPAHRANMKHTLKRGNPNDVYKLYESYSLYMEGYLAGSVK